MLNVLGESIMVKGKDGEEDPLDFALAWEQSSNCEAIALQVSEATKFLDEAKHITYSGKYAVKVSTHVCNLVCYSATTEVRLIKPRTSHIFFPYPNHTVV